MAIIFLNMISMAMNYDDCDSGYEYILKFANWIFTGIFIGECILKIAGYGISGYFYFGWNKFFIVIGAQLIYLAIAFGIATLLYRKGVKKLNVNGG